MLIGRRDFFKTSLLLGTTGLMTASQCLKSKITVFRNKQIGVVNPDLYSHFIGDPHDGASEGIYVGKNSKISNINGFRRELVEHLAKIKPGTIRYSGNCFTDYRIRESVTPLDDESDCTNGLGKNQLKRHHSVPLQNAGNYFSTDKYLELCRMVNARPYLDAHLRNINSIDFFKSVRRYQITESSKSYASNEYYWNIANEFWGSGGEFTPEDYAEIFGSLIGEELPAADNLRLICASPSGSGILWTRRFLAKLFEKGFKYPERLDGWAIRYCCGTTGEGIANEFNEEEWYELISRSERMETILNEYWNCLEEFDPSHKIKLMVNEWGAWHQNQKHPFPNYRYAYAATQRDALISAMHLDTFQRHADKVALAAPAHLINSAHSLFLAHEDKFVVTPNFYVFEMYKPHAGMKALQTEFNSPAITFKYGGQSRSISGLTGSASINDKTVTLTVVNPDIRFFRETEIDIREGRIVSAVVSVLTSSQIQSSNSFESPGEIVPKDGNLQTGKNGKLIYRFMPSSVTRLKMTLA